MIRINLLTPERSQSPKKALLGAGQRMTVACSLILVLAVLFVGWRYWSLSRQSNKLDADITASHQETSRLHSIIQQVQDFEQQRAQLQQRVVLIEQLRKDQSGPVHMLDQISRALPQMLWLTELKQTANDVVIDGQSTTQTGVSDFVANLETSGYFKRSIEIVSTVTEPLPRPPGELIKFSLKAQFQAPSAPAAAGPVQGKNAGG
jgi:type IV pilus assembly protein PilN